MNTLPIELENIINDYKEQLEECECFECKKCEEDCECCKECGYQEDDCECCYCEECDSKHSSEGQNVFWCEDCECVYCFECKDCYKYNDISYCECCISKYFKVVITPDGEKELCEIEEGECFESWEIYEQGGYERLTGWDKEKCYNLHNIWINDFSKGQALEDFLELLDEEQQ